MTSGLRQEVRAFLAAELAAGAFEPHCDAWVYGWDEEFSRRLASRGWIGMTVPAEYGGAARTAAERYVVVEELLAAGAPVAAHWAADRQVVPTLLRYGTEEQRRRYLPRICAGECFFAIGMSEPDAGSDLAALRAMAHRVDGGWRVTGTKIWTSHLHRTRDFVALVRTSRKDAANRHGGLSQLIIDPASEGVTVRPIVSMSGEHNFNEVVLDGVYVPDDMVIGTVGDGWAQVTAELTHERSGPERFLSTMPLVRAAAVNLAARKVDDTTKAALGGLVARLAAMRQLSRSVAAAVDEGTQPAVLAALVKEAGTRLEKDSIDTVRGLVQLQSVPNGTWLERLFAEALLHSPGFTLRGGTNEVLRSIVARDLGLR